MSTSIHAKSNLLQALHHQPTSSATDITLQQLDKLTRNQRVNVKATLTMGSLDPKELVKRNGSKGRVKKDCVLEDKTGNAIIYLWDDTAATLTTGQSYEIKNLSVKNFNGRTHLGTTTEATFTPIDPLMKELRGKELLTNIKKTITVEEFKFTIKLTPSWFVRFQTSKRKRHMLLIAKSSLVLLLWHLSKGQSM